MDLVCFDDYDLAVNVAQFPLPVLTGIGHDHDYHVVDMVAYANVKTPTALADYLVDIIAQEDLNLETLSSRLQLAVKGKAAAALSAFDNLVLRMESAAMHRVSESLAALDKLELRVQSADPARTLAKGYALVLKDGHKADPDDLRQGNRLTIMMRDTSLEVIVEKIIDKTI